MQEGYPMVKEAAAFLKRPNWGSALFLYNCYYIATIVAENNIKY
jgi:hypothetical protein